MANNEMDSINIGNIMREHGINMDSISTAKNLASAEKVCYENGKLTTAAENNDNGVTNTLNNIMSSMNKTNLLKLQNQGIQNDRLNNTGHWNHDAYLAENTKNITLNKQVADIAMKNIDVNTLDIDQYKTTMKLSIALDEKNPSKTLEADIENKLLFRQMAGEMSDEDKTTAVVKMMEGCSAKGQQEMINDYKQTHPESFTDEAINERRKQVDNIINKAAEKDPRVDITNPKAVKTLIATVTSDEYRAQLENETAARNADKNVKLQTKPASSRYATTDSVLGVSDLKQDNNQFNR